MKIIPYVNYAENCGIEIQSLYLSEIENGWLRLMVDWDKENIKSKFRHVLEEGCGSCDSDVLNKNKFNEEYGCFRFPFDDKNEFHVGIMYKGKVKYRYQFFSNMKYEIYVYFSPVKFNQTEGKRLYFWKKE